MVSAIAVGSDHDVGFGIFDQVFDYALVVGDRALVREFVRL